jgi:hypothetical protein
VEAELTERRLGPSRARHRGPSGASLGYQLASIIAGGPAPLVATALVVKFHGSLPVAIYIAIGAAIAFLATLGLKDNSHRDITVEYDDKVPAVEAKPHRPQAEPQVR